MNVLIIGGTRGVGREVVAAAHKSGHTLTVMARNAGNFAGAVTGVRMVLGDAGDADDLDRAVAGQQVVVWTVGVKPGRRPVFVFSRGTQYLLAAMDRHQVRRLVCVTGAARDSKGRAGLFHGGLVRPLLLKSTHEDKDRQEAQIRASSLDWTIVRPGTLHDAPPTGLYQTLTTDSVSRPRGIARADVAAFIVDNLAAPEYLHQIVLLTG